MKRIMSVVFCLIAVLFSAVTPVPAAAEEDDFDEAQRLYREFLDEVAGFDTTEDGKRLMSYYDEYSENYAQLYTNATFHPAEEYMNMSSMDRFIWHNVYMHPFEKSALGKGSSAFDQYEDLCTHKRRADIAFINDCGTNIHLCGEKADAIYREMMAWIESYYLKHHDLYNFIENKSFLDYARENDSGYKSDPEVASKLYTLDFVKASLTKVLDRYIEHDRFDNRLEAISEKSEEYSELFARATGRPAEDYLNMTDKDQLFAYITYLGLYEELEGVTDYSYSFDYWYNYTCFRSRIYAEMHTDDFMQLYKELMQICHEYYMTNGELYGFDYKKKEPESSETISSASQTASEEAASIAAARVRDKPKDNTMIKTVSAIAVGLVIGIGVLFAASKMSGNKPKEGL